MKALCICQGGNVRSVAMATELKQRYHIDALAAGYVKNSGDTMTMLFHWADVIVVMKDEYREQVPTNLHVKLRVADVGDDTYGTPSDRGLREQVKHHAKVILRSMGKIV